MQRKKLEKPKAKIEPKKFNIKPTKKDIKNKKKSRNTPVIRFRKISKRRK